MSEYTQKVEWNEWLLKLMWRHSTGKYYEPTRYYKVPGSGYTTLSFLSFAILQWLGNESVEVQ